MSLMGFAFSCFMRGRMKCFLRDIDNPSAAQLERLRCILFANSNCDFGREHGFSSIQNFDDYRHAVPIRQPDEFLPYVSRMKSGDDNVLVSQPLEMFSLTSGTSSEPKYCPVTRPFTLEHHHTHLLWMRHLVADHPGVLGGGLLSIVSPAESEMTKGATPAGAASGRQYLNQAIPVRRRHAVPYEAFGIKDYASRYHAILVFALARRDMSVVTSVNPSTLVMLAGVMRERGEELLADLEAGRLANAGGIDASARAVLEAKLKPQKRRAAELRERLKADGFLLPVSAWPDITMINCWQGGSAPFYLGQLDALWGKAPRRCLGLRASEGTFSIPLHDHTPDGVLAVGGHVMEFVEGEDEVKPDTPTMLAHQLEVGRRYRLIITTSGGFYRYDIGDIVEVTGMRGNTPEVAFLHKAGGALSITGEKVTEDQVVGVMHSVSEKFPNCIGGFSVTLQLSDTPVYVLAVEPQAGADFDDEKCSLVLKTFEESLRVVNPEYDEKRDSARLGEPQLWVLEKGSYRAHRAALVAEGRPDGQIKPPHLVPAARPGESGFFQKMRIVRKFGQV